MLNEAVEEDSGKDFASDDKERDPSMVVARLPVSLSLVEMDNGGVLKLLGITSCCHMVWKSSVSFCTKTGHPALKTSDGMEPGALPFERSLIAFMISDSFGGSDIEVLIGTCGMWAMALPLMEDGLFRTLLKCSAHLSRISVSAVL